MLFIHAASLSFFSLTSVKTFFHASFNSLSCRFLSEETFLSFKSQITENLTSNSTPEHVITVVGVKVIREHETT